MFFFKHKKDKEHKQKAGEKSTSNLIEKVKKQTVIETKKKTEYEMSGMALFKDKCFDIAVIEESMKKMANLEIEVQQDAENPTFIVKQEEDTFICTYFPMPVPNEEVQSHLKVNALDRQTIQDIEEHQAFLTIVRSNQPYQDKIKACFIFTKIASVLMMQPNAVAVYLESLHYILSAQRYYAFMSQMMEAESQGEIFFPYPLWIKTSLLKSPKGISAVTYGLEAFGLYELGFAETKRTPEEIFKILMNLCEMYLIEKCHFQDGDSMKLDPKTEAIFKLEDKVLYIVEK